MHVGAWDDPETVSCMASHDRLRNENDKITTQCQHHFCDNKKHDWGAAITCIQHSLVQRYSEFSSKHVRNVGKFVCHSDQSEFKCSWFSYELGHIVE